MKGLIKDFHDLDFEERPDYLYNLAALRGFPLIIIEESTNADYADEDEDDYVPDYTGTYCIDSSKFFECMEPFRDMGKLDYVGHILENALKGRTEMSSSRKYSFGDTPEWWGVFAPEGEERPIIRIDVGINY